MVNTWGYTDGSASAIKFHSLVVANLRLLKFLSSPLLETQTHTERKNKYEIEMCKVGKR